METVTDQPFIVAAVQATPAFLDTPATLQRVVALIDEAADAGARLVVFPEAFVPGYPDWVWRTTPWGGGSSGLYARLAEQAVRVPDDLAPVSAAARRRRVWVALGVDEAAPVGTTVYNSLVYIGPDGAVIGVHRKLMPTGGERLVWGAGDGSGLVTFPTPGGTVGGLICWENYMPLVRAAIYAAGTEIYLAPTWDNSDVWVPTLRHIAKEGRCYVVGTNSFLRGSDVPADALGVPDLYGGDDDWMSRGNACIVGPDGEVVAGPLIGEPGILYAEVDRERIRRERLQFDVCGHYARPDVVSLVVDRSVRGFARTVGPDDPGTGPADEHRPVAPAPAPEPAGPVPTPQRGGGDGSR